MEIVLKENSSSMYFPAMLRFRRLSAVTAMMAMTMPITIQRTRVGLAASTLPLGALRRSSRRFFISERLPFSARFLGVKTGLRELSVSGASSTGRQCSREKPQWEMGGLTLEGLPLFGCSED